MLFHVLASPDRVVRVGRSISDRRVFREGQGARFRPGKRASSGREALLAPLLVVLGQFAQRVDQRAGERFAAVRALLDRAMVAMAFLARVRVSRKENPDRET